MKKYNILNSENAFACFSLNTLVYGNAANGKGIYLNDNFLKNKNREDQSTKVYDVTSDYCLTGEKDFEVEEVEIYQIIFK